MATTTNQLHLEKKHNFILDRLLKMGVKQSQTGKSIYELDYEEAKYELVLAEFRKIDAECESEKWF